MTLNRRLATAAAAIVQRMISRSRPRVFRPESPLKKGSMESAIILNSIRLEVLNIVFSWTVGRKSLRGLEQLIHGQDRYFLEA